MVRRGSKIGHPERLDYAQDVIYVVRSIANIIGGVGVYMIFNEHGDLHFDKK